FAPAHRRRVLPGARHRLAGAVVGTDGCVRLRARRLCYRFSPIAMLPERPAADAIRKAFLADEADAITRLLPVASLSAKASARVWARARGWVEAVRVRPARSAGMESFLHQYDLSTQEGVLLMCVAEALLRIPDAATADRLIRDKLSRGDWQKHLGQ